MDEERRKRARSATLDELEEERASQVMPTIESETDEDETSASDESTDEDFDFSEDEFFYSEIQSDQIGFFDEDDPFEEMEEDDIDPDELSYEELIALGEMVGAESKGISEDEISKYLNPLTCQSTTNLLIERCVICQVEYEEGEQIVTLYCDHPYHSDCITQWLQIKKTCPVCGKEVSSAEMTNTSNMNKRLM
ncbi:E3 ubiquitin ligase BIG BROTHER-related-like [Henckelia pumila]|uniref:E3 ubiquitin ligase BIG BROTHER-related-like n=1 Tax=Henckelia pumila TaxID=405737 RepID=UPI003C6E46A6